MVSICNYSALHFFFFAFVSLELSFLYTHCCSTFVCECVVTNLVCARIVYNDACMCTCLVVC